MTFFPAFSCFPSGSSISCTFPHRAISAFCAGRPAVCGRVDVDLRHGRLSRTRSRSHHATALAAEFASRRLGGTGWPCCPASPPGLGLLEDGKVLNYRGMPLARLAPRQKQRRFYKSAQRKAKTTVRAASEGLVAISLCLLLTGCHPPQSKHDPSIEFSKIPPAAQGGRERVDTIAGRVVGASPGQKVVVYARSGPWWVQPWPDQPFIPIRADSTWSTQTHLGYEYAALVVDQAYHPPPTMDVAPTPGGSVLAVTITKGVGSLAPNPTKALQFSGYDWTVRTVAADAGGVNRPYAGENAWTDGDGALHLRISKKADQWTCAQVVLTRSLGYGTYVVVTRDTSHLEPPVVLSMETFDEWAGQENYREMGVEISRWGNVGAENNAQYDVQPFYLPGNVVPFRAPSGVLTHSLRWEPGRAKFETVRGPGLRTGAPVVSGHVFASGIPVPGKDLFQFTLYLVASDKSPLQNETEVVVEKFEYLP